MILVIDTAGKEIKIGLVFGEKIEHITFEGGRELSVKLFENLDCLYKRFTQQFNETNSIIVNSGPGSFTGLRIGISTANAMAYSLDIPVVGIKSPKDFEELINRGKIELKGKEKFTESVLPEYGSEPHITQPKNK
jgi:tRNA threonylcarbamoyl adenosine modification protein YeaZ